MAWGATRYGCPKKANADESQSCCKPRFGEALNALPPPTPVALQPMQAGGTAITTVAPCRTGTMNILSQPAAHLLSHFEHMLTASSLVQVVRFPYCANELYGVGDWVRLARTRIEAYLRHLTQGPNSKEHPGFRWREVRLHHKSSCYSCMHSTSTLQHTPARIGCWSSVTPENKCKGMCLNQK